MTFPQVVLKELSIYIKRQKPKPYLTLYTIENKIYHGFKTKISMKKYGRNILTIWI